MDIGWVIDRSGSMRIQDCNGSDTRKECLVDFISNIAAQFPTGLDIRMGAAEFTALPAEDTFRNFDNDLVDFSLYVNGLTTTSGGTNTGAGIEKARLDLFLPNDRAHARKVVVVISDGVGCHSCLDEANVIINEDKVNFIYVPVGEGAVTNVFDSVSSATTISAPSFSQEDLGAIKQQLLEAILCFPGTAPPTATPSKSPTKGPTSWQPQNNTTP
jgi:hypothetical protein